MTERTFAASVNRTTLGKPAFHASGHLCWFPSCPLEACRQAQKDAELYGFDSEGEINFPPRTKLPWEQDAA